MIGGVTRRSDFINREEYFPYGETSFGSFARKRYRFTGKERDEESGLVATTGQGITRRGCEVGELRSDLCRKTSTSCTRTTRPTGSIL